MGWRSACHVWNTIKTVGTNDALLPCLCSLHWITGTRFKSNTRRGRVNISCRPIFTFCLRCIHLIWILCLALKSKFKYLFDHFFHPGQITGVYIYIYIERQFLFLFLCLCLGKYSREGGFLGGFNLHENGARQVLGVSKCLKMNIYGINHIYEIGANNSCLFRRSQFKITFIHVCVFFFTLTSFSSVWWIMIIKISTSAVVESV